MSTIKPLACLLFALLQLHFAISYTSPYIALVDWARNSGVNSNIEKSSSSSSNRRVGGSFEIHANVKCTAVSLTEGTGLVASDPIKKHERFLSVPLSECISTDDWAKDTELGRQLYDEGILRSSFIEGSRSAPPTAARTSYSRQRQRRRQKQHTYQQTGEGSSAPKFALYDQGESLLVFWLLLSARASSKTSPGGWSNEVDTGDSSKSYRGSGDTDTQNDMIEESRSIASKESGASGGEDSNKGGFVRRASSSSNGGSHCATFSSSDSGSSSGSAKASSSTMWYRGRELQAAVMLESQRMTYLTGGLPVYLWSQSEVKRLLNSSALEQQSHDARLMLQTSFTRLKSLLSRSKVWRRYVHHCSHCNGYTTIHGGTDNSRTNDYGASDSRLNFNEESEEDGEADYQLAVVSGAITLEEYEQAWGAVVSRAFSINCSVLGKKKWIVPIADIMNHIDGGGGEGGEGECGVSFYNSGTRSIDYHAAKALRADRSLCWTYGKLCNADLLLHYGFTLPVPAETGRGGGRAEDGDDLGSVEASNSASLSYLNSMDLTIDIEEMLQLVQVCGATDNRATTSGQGPYAGSRGEDGSSSSGDGGSGGGGGGTADEAMLSRRLVTALRQHGLIKGCGIHLSKDKNDDNEWSSGSSVSAGYCTFRLQTSDMRLPAGLVNAIRLMLNTGDGGGGGGDSRGTSHSVTAEVCSNLPTGEEEERVWSVLAYLLNKRVTANEVQRAYLNCLLNDSTERNDDVDDDHDNWKDDGNAARVVEARWEAQRAGHALRVLSSESMALKHAVRLLEKQQQQR